MLELKIKQLTEVIMQMNKMCMPSGSKVVGAI